MEIIKLYKYASINSAINIIKNSSVLLNSPNNFNDPFDSLINISDEEKQRVLDLIINYYTFKIFCDFVNREDLNLKISQKILFKTIKLEIAAYTKLIKKSKTYNILPFFNDMVDNFSEINDDIKIAIDDAKDKLENEIIPSLKKMRSKARISCFSTKNDSILMWSHYADSHRGVCFEFEENRDFFKSVNYSSQRANINLYDAISRVLAFDFLNEKISYKDKKFADIMLNPLYTKSLEWAYENEVRCVLSDEEYNTSGFFYSDNKCMLKMNISRIYIGSKAFGDNLLFSNFSFDLNRSDILERENREFVGWFVGNDPEDEQFTNESIVTKDMTLYARYSSLVTFDMKKDDIQEKDKGYYLKECSYGRFSRSVRLPDNIAEDKIEAKFKKGVLTIDIPKCADMPPKARRIAIKA